jgi:hypothetical protein
MMLLQNRLDGENLMKVRTGGFMVATVLQSGPNSSSYKSHRSAGADAVVEFIGMARQNENRCLFRKKRVKRCTPGH